MSFIQIAYVLHVFGIVMWVAGLMAVSLLLQAVDAETDAGARGRLAAFTRKMARIPDIGATLALLFGLHIFFANHMQKAHYLHVKFVLVLALFGLHGFIRVKTKRAAEGKPSFVPWFRPVIGLIVLAILFVLFTRLPA